MSGNKMLINDSDNDLTIVITPRIGSDPSKHGQPVSVVVPAHARKDVSYGNDQNPYISALNASLKTTSGSYVEAEQSVLERGSAVDDKFNTNDTLTFTLAKENMEIVGSNTL